jgi:hypothetical protein
MEFSVGIIHSIDSAFVKGAPLKYALKTLSVAPSAGLINSLP